jgi:hypothetical protein
MKDISIDEIIMTFLSGPKNRRLPTLALVRNPWLKLTTINN